jgi:hypothetical protein
MSKASTVKVEKLEKGPARKSVVHPEQHASPVIETASALDIVMPGVTAPGKDVPVQIETGQLPKAEENPAGQAGKARQAKKPKQDKQKAPEGPSSQEEPSPDDKSSRKTKLVRHSFTLPMQDYDLLGEMKKACRHAGIDVKKTELLRVSLGLLKQLDEAKLKAAIAALPPLKKRRDKKSKQA